jgi:hypothetical protein
LAELALVLSSAKALLVFPKLFSKAVSVLVMGISSSVAQLYKARKF